MKKVIFDTKDKQRKGLIGMKPIPKDTLFFFPNPEEDGYFHSRGVKEPFEIVFFDKNNKPLKALRMTPPDDIAHTPEGAVLAVEAADGTFTKKGFNLGQVTTSSFWSDYGLYLVAIAAGAGLGFYGYKNDRKVALIAGVGITAAGAALLYKKVKSS